jgi:RNA polymerase sigma-70 factor (ECF subfamily)
MAPVSSGGKTGINASARRIEMPATSAKSCDLPDDVLVTAAMNGDSRSFELLIGRYQRAILAVGRRMTGSFADAEDIAQQTFMKAFIAISSFQRRSSFSTWLTTIALNEARMWKRKKSRLREIPNLSHGTKENPAPPLEVADSRPDPELSYFEKERRVVLFSRVVRLKPAIRSALEVCDLQEESTEATALLLGITVSAVKSRRSRGRAALRKALAHYHS